MSALKDTNTQKTSMPEPISCGAITGFGALLIRSAASVGKPAMNIDTAVVDPIGWAIQPANNVVLDADGFYQATNNAGVPDIMRFIDSGDFYALVIASAAHDILQGDFLELADIGDHGQYLGVLEEAGAAGNVGETRVFGTCVAQAKEDMTLGTSYVIPESVAVGDKTITLSSGNMTTLNVTEGDYIVLEDLNGSCQLNRVKSKTATVLTLQLASTVALTKGNSDLVHKVFQIKCRSLI